MQPVLLTRQRKRLELVNTVLEAGLTTTVLTYLLTNI